MTSNSTSSKPDFWYWVRAALANRPVNDGPPHGDDLPPVYRVNDYWAMARQGESWRAQRAHLVLLLLATVTAVLAGQLGSRVQAVLAAVLYGLTLVVGARAARRRADPDGHLHRVAAETVKSMAWLYMVHGGPFHSRVADPEALFTERLEGAFRQLRTMGWQDPLSTGPLPDSDQITPTMRTLRAKPLQARRDAYLRDRLQEQTEWYRRVSAKAQTAARLWSAATITATLLALLTTALQAAGLIGGWCVAGLLSTAVAAAVAWQEARRFRPTAATYALVEQDLETARIAMATTVTEENWAGAVAETERLMSPPYTDLLMRGGPWHASAPS
ncbi:DUF4231 domain-containing protein [Streptomyces sp. NPDC002265]|uniref:DUF4231 domain-containing protein n=1 Tax=Streptomyces sp. NPDC002265 TaxID=3154415 RepID=UPI00331DEFC3